MNTRLIWTCLASLAISGYLFGQGGQTLVVNVPFAFQAGSVMFPAGEYSVSSVSPVLVRISSEDGKNNAMTITNSVSKLAVNEQAKLIFNRYGEKYFLSQIWPLGTQGRMLPPGRAERETLQAIAATRTQRTLIARTK